MAGSDTCGKWIVVVPGWMDQTSEKWRIEMARRDRKRGTFLISVGLLMMIAALLLTAYNIWDERRAGEDTQGLLDQMEEQNQEDEDTIPDYLLNPDMEMPVVEIGGYFYLGRIDIPALGLSLPVMDSWDYSKLRIAPCRYEGSVYKGDMIIAGHNYRSHFGYLKNLNIGDQVVFTDVRGNRFLYQVTDMEVLNPENIDGMRAGDWDLTLFTCTYGGQTRMTIRCSMEK